MMSACQMFTMMIIVVFLCHQSEYLLWGKFRIQVILLCLPCLPQLLFKSRKQSAWCSVLRLFNNHLSSHLCRYETSTGALSWKAWSHPTKEIIPVWWRTITGPSITRTTLMLLVSLLLPERQPRASLLQLYSFEIVKVSLVSPHAFRRLGLFSFFLNTRYHLGRILLSFDNVLFPD